MTGPIASNRYGLPSRMTWKSGRYYYLEPKVGGIKWVSLSKNLDDALQQYRGLTGEFIAAEQEAVAPSMSMVRSLRRTFDAAKKRSKDKDATYFTLTWDDVLERATRQNWRCAMTGLRFSEDERPDAHARPFMPSIDRIRCTEGYTPANVRLVCVAVNLALSTFGEAVFGKLARAYVDATKPSYRPKPAPGNQGR